MLTALNWIRTHPRLIIEYLMILAMVVLAGTVFSLKLHAAHQDLTIATTADTLKSTQDTLRVAAVDNAAQDVAIKALHDLQQKNDQQIQSLQGDVQNNAKVSDGVRAKVKTLEINNAAAKQIIDSTVPPQLGCVLDRNCPAATPAHADSSGRPETE